jgi:site-specific DNA-methyltransferase (adenine-specific)
VSQNSKIFFKNDTLSIINDDVLKTNEIIPNSIDLIITSPPYNVDIKYNSHEDTLSYDEYLAFSQKWMKRCFDWLKDDGRFCLNIPLDINKGGQRSVGADLTKIAKDIGFNYHSTIIWNEGNISRRTAWGSFQSASAPYVIAPVELIVVLYKKEWKKTSGSKDSKISKKDFMDWTNGLWTFSGESKKKVGHPAPFPVELPKRCIQLFSYVNDTVLDPFLGSGSTLVASYLNKRIGIGIEIDTHYCKIALDRLKKEGGLEQISLDYYQKSEKQEQKTIEKRISQSILAMGYFKANAGRDVKVIEVVEWVKAEYQRINGLIPQHTDREIRKLAEKNEIKRPNKGTYRYEPRLNF